MNRLSVTGVGLLAAALLAGGASGPAFAGTANPAAASNWTSAGYDVQSTYFNPGETTLGPGNVGNLVQKWQISNQVNAPYASSQPLVSGGKAYFSLTDGRFLSVLAKSGKVVWTYTPSCAGAQTPAMSGGVVYFDGCDGNLYALQASTGSLVWTAPVSPDFDPLVAGGILFVASGSDIYALNPGTGQTEWVYDNAKLPAASGELTYSGGLLYFVAEVPNTEGGVVAVALHAKSGRVAWRTKFMLLSWDYWSNSPVTIANGVAYVWAMAGSAGGALYAMTASTGALLWSDSSSWFSGNIAVADGVVYGLFGGEMNAIQTATNTTLWQITDGDYGTGAGGTVANGVVYFGGNGGVPEAADATSGAVLWQAPASAGSPSTGLTVADGQMLYEMVGANNGQVFSFQLPAR